MLTLDNQTLSTRLLSAAARFVFSDRVSRSKANPEDKGDGTDQGEYIHAVAPRMKGSQAKVTTSRVQKKVFAPYCMDMVGLKVRLALVSDATRLRDRG